MLDVASVVVAAIVGAMEGHTTDIGFLQGGLLGVVAGVITASQLFGLMLHGDQPLSKVIVTLYITLESQIKANQSYAFS